MHAPMRFSPARPRRALVATLAALAVVLAAAIPGAARAQGGQQPASPVVVAPVEQVRRAPSFEYTGLIEPSDKALLSAEVSGRVERVLKRRGDRVEKGEVVARLENPTMSRERKVLQAQVAATEAELSQARQQQRRNAELFRRNLISAEQYEDGAAKVEVTAARLSADRARLERLQDQLERMVIRAPLSGQIVEESVEVGQWITPNNPLFEIYNYEAFDVTVGVPGRYVGSVPEEGRVRMTVPELKRTLQADILAKIAHVQSSTGNFTLRLRVRNPEGLPLSGLLAKVDVPLGPPTVVLAVPRDAIVRQGGNTHVVVVRDGKSQIVPVMLRGALENAVFVEAEGLAEGERVVVRGNERLFPGMPVKVTDTLPTLSAKG